MTIDHPNVRNLTRCPRCTTPKEVGLVLCWQCFRALKRQHDGGIGAYYTQYLDCLEHVLDHEDVDDLAPASDDVPSFADCVTILTS